MTRFAGNWSAGPGDEELYDYNNDKWETTNFASNTSYGSVLAELRTVLRNQYTSTSLESSHSAEQIR